MSDLISVDTSALMGDSIIQVAEQAEKRIEAVNKIKMLALKVTNHQDWVDMGGKPYLQGSGSEKVARLFGISWTISEPVLETSDDGHFSYTYMGVFSLSGASIEAVGTRSSKDPFFSRSKGKDLPPSEIDRGDIKKAAYSNCTANGVTRLLGIRNLTWNEVRDSGVNVSGVNKVEYGNKSANIPDDDSYSDKRKEHHTRIESVLQALYGADQAAKDAKLIELTTWTKNKGKDNEEVVKGTANFKGIKNDKTVEILCHNLEKLVPKQGADLPAFCNECRTDPCCCEK